MAAKTPELAVFERIAASLEELVTVNKKVLKELRDDTAQTSRPPARPLR